jgi:hypothetical protein
VYAIFYDALMRFFSQARHAGELVPAVFARPDRASQEWNRIYKRRLQGQKQLAGLKPGDPPMATTQAVEDRPAPRPFLSIYMPVPHFDQPRWNPGRVVIDKDIATGTARTVKWPRPVLGNVQVDLWTNVDLEAQDIAAQIDLRFVADAVKIPIDWSLDKWFKPPFNVLEHARYFGKTGVRLVVDPGWEDTSDLEEGDGPKDVRYTWRGKLQAFIPYKPEEGRLVRTMTFNLYDNTNPATPVLIDAITTGSED